MHGAVLHGLHGEQCTGSMGNILSLVPTLEPTWKYFALFGQGNKLKKNWCHVDIMWIVYVNGILLRCELLYYILQIFMNKLYIWKIWLQYQWWPTCVSNAKPTVNSFKSVSQLQTSQMNLSGRLICLLTALTTNLLPSLWHFEQQELWGHWLEAYSPSSEQQERLMWKW